MHCPWVGAKLKLGNSRVGVVGEAVTSEAAAEVCS